ncbi:hypothetical protein VTP01DRAFT_7385 [Rhizomucor pusillus]|uniref:uncharacterized protein n=1 Tax=Rhizomucor pusillus TaxID=4840 RepID=UPI003743FBC4
MAAVEEKIAIEKDVEIVAQANSSTNSEDYDYVPPDDKEWKRLRWKLDLRIVPYVGILYLCSFLDRVNIGK